MFMNKMLSREACIERYGPIDLASQHWPNANIWIRMFEVPPLFPNWRVMHTDAQVKHIACNLDIHRPLGLALGLIIHRGLEKQLFTFDGGWNIRSVRNGNQMSAHAWGLAIDINADSNRLGEQPSMSQELVSCFTEVGFDWGGRFHRMDGMHMSYCFEGPKPNLTLTKT